MTYRPLGRGAERFLLAYPWRVQVWPAGTAVLWRSVHEDAVATVLPMRVVSDEGSSRALFLCPGTTTKRRTGERGGPRGRLMLRWDGGYEDRTWGRNRVLILNEEGDPFSIWLIWDDKSGELLEWYINLEDPWRRTALGFDSRDRVLDIVVSPDLTEWKWKDEDEFQWRLEQGGAPRPLNASVRSDGLVALERLRDPGRNFGRWLSWKPDPLWTVPPVAQGWDELIVTSA